MLKPFGNTKSNHKRAPYSSGLNAGGMAERLKAAVLKISIAVDSNRLFCNPKYIQDTFEYACDQISTGKLDALGLTKAGAQLEVFIVGKSSVQQRPWLGPCTLLQYNPASLTPE